MSVKWKGKGGKIEKQVSKKAQERLLPRDHHSHFSLISATLLFPLQTINKHFSFPENKTHFPFLYNVWEISETPFLQFSFPSPFSFSLPLMMVAKKHYCCCEWKWIVLCQLFLATVVCSSHNGNPANDLVDIINKNRTSQKLPQLNDNPGLGCMALQYVELCKGNCTSNGVVNCKPPEDDFTEVFGPNCGVELPTFGTVTGHIVGCQPKYLEPSPAFSHVLVKDSKALSIIRNKSHTEVGVGLVGAHKGSFFWCILFSDGKTNSSFILEDNGEGIKQKKGCFSGSTFPCSRGQRIPVFLNNVLALVLLHISLLQNWYPTW